MNKKNLLAVCVLLFGVFAMAQAQMNKNALYANLGGAYQLGAGVHYERVLIGGKNLHLAFGAGLGQSFNKSDSKLPGGTYIPTSLNVAAGLKGHYLEVGAGPTANLGMTLQDGAKMKFSPALVGGHVQVGYKFISQKKPGLYLKVYGDGLFISDTKGTNINNIGDWFNGTIGAKMLPSAGVSVGLAF